MKNMRRMGVLFCSVLVIGLMAGCQKKGDGGSTSSGGGETKNGGLVNDPSVILLSGVVGAKFTYNVSGQVDTHTVNSQVLNISSSTATDVKLNISATADFGGGTLASVDVSIPRIEPGASASWTALLDLVPDTSMSHGWTVHFKVLQAMVDPSLVGHSPALVPALPNDGIVLWPPKKKSVLP